jgi:serine phosphatase RsbU (regulator of sigma subunit)
MAPGGALGCAYVVGVDSADESAVVAAILRAASAASPVAAVEAVTGQLGSALDARSVSFLIADLSGRALVRLANDAGEDSPGGDGDAVVVVPFDGGPREQALRDQMMLRLRGGDQWTVFCPVTERGEVIGLLEIDLPVEPELAVLRTITAAAHALAFVVIANRRHTDVFERGQRTAPLSLSAEIQRRLLPAAFTCEAESFRLSAWLEPSSDIAGDSFDYSLDGETLHFSITDAMGHGVASALTATLCVGSLRNSRRRHLALREQADAANTAVEANAGVAGSYVTAVLGRLDLRTGACSLLNAGHVRPILVRDGESAEVMLPRNFPLGMFDDAVYETGEIILRPGDRLVLFTDGMRERAAAGIDLSSQLKAVAGMHPREAVRSLVDTVVDLAGPVLADDAALLIVDWHGIQDRSEP